MTKYTLKFEADRDLHARLTKGFPLEKIFQVYKPNLSCEQRKTVSRQMRTIITEIAKAIRYFEYKYAY